MNCNRNPKRVGKKLVSLCGMVVLPEEKEMTYKMANECGMSLTDYLMTLVEMDYKKTFREKKS